MIAASLDTAIRDTWRQHERLCDIRWQQVHPRANRYNELDCSPKCATSSRLLPVHIHVRLCFDDDKWSCCIAFVISIAESLVGSPFIIWCLPISSWTRIDIATSADIYSWWYALLSSESRQLFTISRSMIVREKSSSVCTVMWFDETEMSIKCGLHTYFYSCQYVPFC